MTASVQGNKGRLSAFTFITIPVFLFTPNVFTLASVSVDLWNRNRNPWKKEPKQKERASKEGVEMNRRIKG